MPHLPDAGSQHSCPASFAAGEVGPRADLKDQQAGAQAVSRSELRAAQDGEGAGPRPGDRRERALQPAASGAQGTARRT